MTTKSGKQLIFSKQWTSWVRNYFAFLRLVWVIKTAILETVRRGQTRQPDAAFGHTPTCCSPIVHHLPDMDIFH
jgi:hypothetical protein